MDETTAAFDYARIERCSSVGIACRLGLHEQLVRLLADGNVLQLPQENNADISGAEIVVRDNRGWTGAHEAAFSGHGDCLATLLAHARVVYKEDEEFSSLVNAQAHDGSTPLILASQV